MIGTTEQELKDFFEGKDLAFHLFMLIREKIGTICPPKITVSKTQISFGEDYKYVWIWLPQTWIKKREKEGIALTVLTGERINSPRVEESIEPKKGFWTHHILITRKEDIDDEVEKLIRESYSFYLKRKKRKK